MLDTAGNIFAITGVQLEPGPYATQFEHRPNGLELALCKRYYETGSAYVDLRIDAGAQGVVPVSFAVQKRAVPTITQSAAYAAYNCGNTAYAYNVTTAGFSTGRNWTGSGGGVFINGWTASAEL